ncbi:VOC family protein [Agrococcus terreus]|uniref:VOC family protein n=1 Tax=Agrococcus terreus TaxID=574649 RepID=UPI00384C8D2A
MAVRSGFPILETLDLARLERFSLDAFAFQDGRGRDVSVSLQVGGASLGIGLAEDLDGPPRATVLWLSVDDVDDAYRRALDAGATSVAEPADQVWGERVAQVDDPDGRRVSIGAEG